MTPLFIVSPPRSRATVLARILNATGQVAATGEADELMGQIRGMAAARQNYARRNKDEQWPRHQLPAGSDGKWRDSALNLLTAWVQPQEGDTHLAVTLPWLGREGMTQAFEWWSWLLNTWPESKILFLHRDQGEIELSMLVTGDIWMPKWGKCVSCCGGRVHGMQDAMREFHWLNPSRTLAIDADAMVVDHATIAEPMGTLGIEVSLEAWESVVSEVLGSRKQLKPFDPTDPFHPLATMETLMTLEKPEQPSAPDPFAPNASLETLMAIPKPEPTREDKQFTAVAETKPLRLEVPKGYKAITGKDLAVYTLRWGHLDWMDHCIPTQEAWAERHGYEIDVWGQPGEGKYPNPKFSCLDMIRHFLASGKKFMLYFDADVIFHPDAPAWEEKKGFRVGKDLCNNPRFWRDLDRWMKRRYPALRKSGHIYRNAGVWSCDRDSAKRFLKEAESHPRLIEGCMEQHQFNIFWQRAAQVGMKLEMLPVEWNMMVHTHSDKPAWLFHLAGGEEHKPKYLDRLYRNGLAPEQPRPFEAIEPRSEKAIVIPWIIGPEQWEELRMSLRSWHRFFADKECPIYILGDAPPKWLKEGGRVQFIEMEGYRKNRDKGYFEARYTGYQIAEKVLFTNDDIYLLKDQDWPDFEVALTEGVLHRRVTEYLRAGKPFTRLLGHSAADLLHHGVKKVWRFATHTPFLFEREKAIEILQKFHVRYKGTFANFYHNWHRTPRRRCGKDKTMMLPAPPEARFLNHTGAMPSAVICDELMKMFPDPAPWENPDVPMVNPEFPPGTRICVASFKEDTEWLKDVEFPAVVYDATGDSDDAIPVPNSGREAGQYLRHIIANYGRFADYEIFLQAHPFDHNPTILEDLKARPWEGKRTCPLGYVLGKANQANLPDAIRFAKDIGVHYHQDKPWVHGALFAASREALMSRSLTWWKQVLAKVESEPKAPWAIERLWLTILEPTLEPVRKNP